jgi:tetraprenyl-beta-curcumene synthase
MTAAAGYGRRQATVGLGRQGATLARSTGRELTWGLRAVSHEVERWRRHAAAIPDPELAADALRALGRKRGNIHGAALFWTLPDRRSRDLLEVLVAYEVLADYLDCVSERGAELGIANGRRLHLALVEAVDLCPPTPPTPGLSDYYRFHSSREDGGYLRALVQTCRSGCRRLPSYGPVRPFLMRAAGCSAVLGLNHEPDSSTRERALREWDGGLHAALPGSLLPALPGGLPSTLPGRGRADPARQSWFERTAGASAWLTVLAMLALAAEPARAAIGRARDEEAARTYAAYLHWIAPAGAMLDSLGDIAEDAANGDHSYIAYYPSTEAAVERVGGLVRRARLEARALPGGARHSVIAACMVAFYLSKDSVGAPELREGARELRRAGGPLVELLLPVLRLWRTAYGQRAA